MYTFESTINGSGMTKSRLVVLYSFRFFGLFVEKSYHRLVSQIKFVGTFTQLCGLVFLLMDKFPEQYPTIREAIIEAGSLWEGLLYKGE